MKRIKIFFVWLMVVIPFPLLLFFGEGDVLFNLAKATGLAALSAMAIAFVLGCRSYWLNRFFQSLSLSYRLHHHVGVAASSLLVLHVLLSVMPYYLVDTAAAWEFLFNFKDSALGTGWAALLLFFSGLIFSYIRSLNRPVWRWAHRLFVFSFPFVLIHFWLSVPQMGPAEVLTSIFSIISMIILALHFFFPEVLRKTAESLVTETKWLGPSTVEISLTFSQGYPTFTPGQFAYLSVNCTKGCGVSHEFHPFTLVSDPDGKTIKMAVQALGDDTEKLLHLVPGCSAILEGPYGGLLSDVIPSEKQLWIAGGIGVTPFVGLLRHWRLSEGLSDIFLILLVHRARDNVFKEELTGVPGVTFVIHSDEEEGPPDLDQLLPEDWRIRSIALSGSVNMVKHIRKYLKANGAIHIKSEEFDF